MEARLGRRGGRAAAPRPRGGSGATVTRSSRSAARHGGRELRGDALRRRELWSACRAAGRGAARCAAAGAAAACDGTTLRQRRFARRACAAVDARDDALARLERKHLGHLRRRRPLGQHLHGVQLAHRPVVLGQVLLDRAGGQQLVVDALDEAALLAVGDAPRDQLDRHLRRRPRSVAAASATSGACTLDSSMARSSTAAIAQRGVADHLGDDALAPPGRGPPADRPRRAGCRSGRSASRSGRWPSRRPRHTSCTSQLGPGGSSTSHVGELALAQRRAARRRPGRCSTPRRGGCCSRPPTGAVWKGCSGSV